MKNTASALVTTFLIANAIAVAPLACAQPPELPVDSPSAPKAAPSSTKLPETPAQQQFKSLSKTALKEIEVASKIQIRPGALTLPQDANSPKRPAAENIQRLEEIRVFGNGDPEDYVAPKPPPMLVFRATLDKQRPMSAKEITQLGLCFIGLCGIYKPDGSPYELSAVDRAEDRKNATTMELARVRGTLQ